MKYTYYLIQFSPDGYLAQKDLSGPLTTCDAICAWRFSLPEATDIFRAVCKIQNIKDGYGRCFPRVIRVTTEIETIMENEVNT